MTKSLKKGKKKEQSLDEMLDEGLFFLLSLDSVKFLRSPC